MTDKREKSIGIFDSGFGGLTVMKAVKNARPHEHILYFGDTARLPYGNKSADTIQRYTLESAHFLVEQGVKVIVIACHTASSHALEEVQKAFGVPVIGVTFAAIEEVVNQAKTGKIGILGTRATISSGFYQQQILHRLPQAEITAISCPLFVPLVEEGYVEHPITEMTVQEYLRPLKRKEVDCVLLGCTHYPLLQSLIQKELGDSVTLIDPATSCATHLRNLLERMDLKSNQEGIPGYQFFVSDDPEKFRLIGNTFLSYPIEHVTAKPL
jgi:glutamate racemase